MCENGIKNGLWDGLAFVEESNEDIGHVGLHFVVGGAPTEDGEEGSKKVKNKVISRGEVADENRTLDGGERLEEMKVLGMVGSVGELEAVGELADEKLKDIA